MKRMLYILPVAMMGLSGIGTASAQTDTEHVLRTVSVKDHPATARQLYDAGEWSAAMYEYGKAAESLTADEETLRSEYETFAALAGARAGQPDAAVRLAAVIAKYPSSPYESEVRFRMAVLMHDEGNYTEAARSLMLVNGGKLPKSERDEYNFTLGHSLFSVHFPGGEPETAMGSSDRAVTPSLSAETESRIRSAFGAIAAGSRYRVHADYYLAYMDYAEGRYTEAKRQLTALADDPSYEVLVPYYLLHIEFLEGNYQYVVEHAPGLIPRTAMPRKAELVRMTAQSLFRQGDYRGALAYMDTYRTLGGGMMRTENYIVGFSLYRETRYQEAAEHLARVTGADDGLSQNASYHLADVYLRLGDKQRAMQSFSIAAASGHDASITEDALFNYGKLLFDTDSGYFNEAVRVLGRYIAEYPSSTRTHEAREYLIAAYYNAHDYKAAYDAILQHPDPDNNVRAALQKITYFRALEYLQAAGGGDGDGVTDSEGGFLDEESAAEAQRLLEVSSQYRYNTKYTALASFWQGEILYARGDYEGAMVKYQDYLRLSPTSEAENTMARYNLGYANFNLARWSEAQKWFDDFLTRHTAPDSYRADAFNREGDIRHAERSYWQAIESYDEAAAVGTPEKYYSAYRRAIMLGLADRPDRKIESLGAIISSREGDYVEAATHELGRTYISREEYSDGARVLSGFTDDYPASQYYLSALSNLGLAYMNMGDGGRSMRYYKMIVERAPYSREAQDAMTAIRTLYVDQGDVDGYLTYAREAGTPTDTGEMQRDSLSFAAAERVYLSGDGPGSIAALEGYVNGDARGRYIPTALNYLSGLYSGAGRHAEAADAYKRLAALTADPAAKGRALAGWVASVTATKDNEKILAMADEAVAMQGVPEKSLLDAAFAKAGVLRARGRVDEAVDIYRTLSLDVQTARGAESAYRVIEYLYEEGDYRRAEEAVFALSQAGTQHGYWLGEAFLTLGDIYAREGDTFQARATYQSIVDGYSPADDGIVAAAKERISNLK